MAVVSCQRARLTSSSSSKAECTYEEALAATSGQVLFASGSPFPTTEYDGKKRRPQQSNNMYVFPGIGLGSILAKVKTIPEELIHASAHGGIRLFAFQDSADVAILCFYSCR